MDSIDLQAISTREKFLIAQVLQRSTFLVNDGETVDMARAIHGADVVLSPQSEALLLGLNGADIKQIRALGIVILKQLELAIYGVV